MYVEAENQELQELLSQIQSSTNSDQDNIDSTNYNTTVLDANLTSTTITDSSNSNVAEISVCKSRFSPAARVSTHDESNGNSNSRDFTNVFSQMKEMSPADLEPYSSYAALLSNDLALSEIVNDTSNNQNCHNESSNSYDTSNVLNTFYGGNDLSSFASNEPCSLIDDKSSSNGNECELLMSNSHTLEIPQEEYVNNNDDDDNNMKVSNAIPSQEIQLEESDEFLELLKQQSSETESYEESASSFINGLVEEQLQPEKSSTELLYEQQQQQQQQEEHEELSPLNNTKAYTSENVQSHMFEVASQTPNVKMPYSLSSTCDPSQRETYINNNNNNNNNRSNSNSSVKSYTLSQVIINPTTKQKSPIIDRGLCMIQENEEDQTNLMNYTQKGNINFYINNSITKITLVSDKPSPTHYTSTFNGGGSSLTMRSPYPRHKNLFSGSKHESHLLNNESSRPVISITASSTREATLMTTNPTQQLQNYGKLNSNLIQRNTNVVEGQYREDDGMHKSKRKEDAGEAEEEWRNDVEEEMIALAQSPSTAQWSAFSHINEGNNRTIHSSVMNNNNKNNENYEDVKVSQLNSSIQETSPVTLMTTTKQGEWLSSSTPVLLNYNDNNNTTTLPPQASTTSVNQILTNAYQQMAASVLNNNNVNNNINSITPHNNNSCTPYQSQAAHVVSFTPESSKQISVHQVNKSYNININNNTTYSMKQKTGNITVSGNNSLTKGMTAPRVNIFALPSPPRSFSAIKPHDLLPVNTSQISLTQNKNENSNYEKKNYNVTVEEESLEEQQTTLFSSIAKLTHDIHIRNTVEEMMRRANSATSHEPLNNNYNNDNKNSKYAPFNLMQDAWSPNRQPVGMTNVFDKTNINKLNFYTNNNRENTLVHRPCSAIVSNESAPSLRPAQRPCSAFTSCKINNSDSMNNNNNTNSNYLGRINDAYNVHVKDNMKVTPNNMLDSHIELKSNSNHTFFNTPENYKQQQQQQQHHHHYSEVGSHAMSPAVNEPQPTLLNMNQSNTLTPTQINNITHSLQRPLMQTTTPNKFSSFYSISHRSTPGKACISPLGLVSPQNTLGRTGSGHNNNHSNKKNVNSMVSPSATRHGCTYGNDNVESRGMTPSLTPVLAMLMGQARFTPIQTNTNGVSGGTYTFYSTTPTHATPSRTNDDVQNNTSHINNNTSMGGKAGNELKQQKEYQQKSNEELQYSMSLAMQEKEHLSALFKHRHSPLQSMDIFKNVNNNNSKGCIMSSNAEMSKVEMDGIAQKVLAMSRDQQGCRLLQAVLHNEVIGSETLSANNMINTPSTHNNNNDNNSNEKDDESKSRIANHVVKNVSSKNEQATRFASSIPVQRILYAVEPVLHEVMADAYGNFLIQKLLEVAPDKERARILALPSLQNNLCHVAASPHGTFAVQRLIETLRSEEEEEIVFCALSRNLLLLLTDVNGGHVLYKMMSFIKQRYYTPIPSITCRTSTLSNFTNTAANSNVQSTNYCTSPGAAPPPPSSSSLKSVSLSQEQEEEEQEKQSIAYFRNIRRKVHFLYSGILQHLLHICRHRQGCCIVQKCIDFFSQLFPAKDGKDEYLLWEQMQSTMHQNNGTNTNSVNTRNSVEGSYITTSASSPSCFPECTTNNTNEMEENYFLGIIRRLVPHIVTLSTDPFGNYVVTHAVEVCFATGNIALVDVMALQLQSKLITLCKNKFASNVIEHVLRHCNERRIRALCRVLMQPQPALTHSNVPSFTVMSPLHNSLPGQIHIDVNNNNIENYNNTYGAHTTSSFVIPLIELAMDAYGNYVVQTLLTVAPVDELVYTNNVKEICNDNSNVHSNLLSSTPYMMSARSLPFNDNTMAGVTTNMTRSLVMSGQRGMLPLLQAHLPELLERNFGKKLETKIDLALLRVSQHNQNYR